MMMIMMMAMVMMMVMMMVMVMVMLLMIHVAMCDFFNASLILSNARHLETQQKIA